MDIPSRSPLACSAGWLPLAWGAAFRRLGSDHFRFRTGLSAVGLGMKISLVCPQCSAENTGVAEFFVETIRDDGLYSGHCPHGHDVLVATQTLRHEMLFEIAMNAIADGYYREAVSSFTSSMERFFEFAVRVMSRCRGAPSEIVEAAWKEVSRKSERQLGAFIFLYIAEFRTVPYLLPKKMGELRNAVTHKGLLPERNDAIEFGASVYEVIQRGVQKLRSTSVDHVNAVLGEHVARVAEKMGARYPRTFQVTPTALNVIEDITSGYRAFDQLLAAKGNHD
jgi:hypothetical protein